MRGYAVKKLFYDKLVTKVNDIDTKYLTITESLNHSRV